MTLPKQIKIRERRSEREGYADTEKYVTAKTRDLRKFGYSTLTEDEVRGQLIAVLNGEKLSVIGMFIEGDIVKPEPADRSMTSFRFSRGTRKTKP